MCGIAGILHFSQEPISEASINKLTDAVAHRGPDGRGIWFNQTQTVALGQRRLSILDLSEAGKQPMPDQTGRYWITFNGEIYNFLEIRAELIAKGYQFHSESDTEVILAAYQAWGQAMLHKFNGMWAFAIYDTQQDELFVARDRFGVKPLYYYLADKILVFASEIQAIHKIIGKNHELNLLVVNDLLRGKSAFHGTTQTYLKDVLSLGGGQSFLVKNGNLQVQTWYHLPLVQPPKTLAAQAEILRELCIDACKLRLRSDVPIGTCLSGGLDSGSITAIISKLQPEGNRFAHYTHRGFCAAFPNSTIDESLDAAYLSKQLGSKLDIVDILPPNAFELEEAMLNCDGFMHALAFYPIWKLYKYIKNQGITVTLDGQGPDEMLGGYSPIQEGLKSAIQAKNIAWFLDIYQTYSQAGEFAGVSAKNNAYQALKSVVKDEVKGLLGKKKVIIPNLESIRNPVNPAWNELDNSLYKQFFQAPLPSILNQYDRASMASGVECRMPFMDYRIVEFVFSLPTTSKVGGGFTKRVLREAMNGILPDETRLRKRKIGFNAPIVEWFRGSLQSWMADQMASQNFLQNSYFDGKKIQADFEQFAKSDKPQWDYAWLFWPPVHFAWWQQKISQFK
jgi:asparagine synthase (glutamine-hydrolysing)